MADVGTQAQYVDAVKFKLTNITDSQTFIQLQNVRFGLIHGMEKKARTDGNIDKFYNSSDNFIEADIMLTRPQIATLVTLATITSGNLPTKTWELNMVDIAGTTTTLQASAQLAQFYAIRPVVGLSMFHIRLECSSITVTVT